VEGSFDMYNIGIKKRRSIMEENIIYTLGETLLLELDGVVDITYPIGVETPQKLIMITDNGNYELTLKKVS
jgi:hypothetical protein